VSTSELSQALAGYVRSIMSGDSPYDRFNAGDRNALTDQQQAGLNIFRGKGNCTRCHVGPTFADERVHNTGVAWRDGRLADEGAGEGMFKDADAARGGTNGSIYARRQFRDAAQVVKFYDGGGNTNPALDPEIRPLRLTEAEKRALATFLSSLTGRIREGERSIFP
jgi:cytochrome c peroxidase